MALTSDVKTIRYGTPDGHQPLAKGVTSGVTIYRGSVALLASGTGFLKNASSVASGDLVLGIVDEAGAGIANTGPGILGTSPSGSTQASIATGSFILASGTGSDALGVTTNALPVYLINETTVGATNGGSTRPLAGIQLSCNADDASIPVGYVAVKLGTPNSPLGGP